MDLILNQGKGYFDHRVGSLNLNFKHHQIVQKLSHKSKVSSINKIEESFSL